MRIVRRIVTWLLLGAVAALGVAAGVDALRGGGEPEREATEAEPVVAERAPGPQGGERTLVDARADLSAAGVPSGVLTYADEDCRLHSVTLPDLRSHPGPEGETCAFTPTRGGELAFGSPFTSPDGVLRVGCRPGRVVFRLPGGVLYGRTAGACGVAWREDSAPTFLRRGEVVELAACPGDEPGALPLRCGRVLLSRDELKRAFRGAGWTRFDFRVEELYWLDARRLATIVQARAPGRRTELLALFDRGRLVAEPTFGYEDLAGIRPSPSGAFLVARILEPGGLVVVDRSGRAVPLAMRHGDALAWSPDEEWIAEATADGVCVFRAGDRNPVFVHVPVVARDLVWR